MANVNDILAALGLLNVSPQARNVLQWPIPPLPPVVVRPRLVEGVLAHSEGDLSTDGSLRPRLSFILGPGATLAGVVAELTDILGTITTRTTAAPIPSRETVAAALQTYSATHLTNTPEDRLFVGFRMPLPIEIDTATGDWVTNLETIETLSRLPPAIDLPGGAVRPLDIPNPDAVRAEVTVELGGAANASDLALGAVTRALRNPFEPVFYIYELFAQVRRGRPAQEEVSLALRMVDNLVNHQAEMLSTTTAGNAFLRRLWFALEPVDAAPLPAAERTRLLRSRRLLAAALGLVPVAPPVTDTWRSPLVAGPTVLPRELALPAASIGLAAVGATPGSVTALEAAGPNQQMVLGRQLSAGDTKTRGGFTGPAHVGRMLPAAFVAAHNAEINPGGDPRIDQRSAIVVAIAPNEGFLDAAALLDPGLMSTGLQQWTQQFNNEANVLWEHLRGMAPDQFDLYLGLYRLLTQIWHNVENAATAVATAAVLTANNPWADAAVVADPLAIPGAPDDHFPDNATLYRLDPRGKVRMHQTAPANIWPRFEFFGGSGGPGARVFSAEWGARVRLAARCSIAYCVAEMQTANKRFDRILRDTGDFLVPGTPAPGGGAPVPRYTVKDLFTSQYGAALILDHHINAPGLVKKSVIKAMAPDSIPPTAGAAFDAPGVFRKQWLEALATSYHTVRRFPTPENKGQRDIFIAELPAATLSKAAGSFRGW